MNRFQAPVRQMFWRCGLLDRVGELSKAVNTTSGARDWTVSRTEIFAKAAFSPPPRCPLAASP